MSRFSFCGQYLSIEDVQNLKDVLESNKISYAIIIDGGFMQGYIEGTKAKNIKKLFPGYSITPSSKTFRRELKRAKFIVSNVPGVKNVDIGEYAGVSWKPWQRKIINIIEEKEPNKRSVYWIYDNAGNVGKTFLYNYIKASYPSTIILEGDEKSILHQIKKTVDNLRKRHKKKTVSHEELKDLGFPRVAMIDSGRSRGDDVDYSVIEKVKDGSFYSPKYGGGFCKIPPVHVIVFANVLPQIEKLSLDRWKIYEIIDDEYLKKYEI